MRLWPLPLYVERTLPGEIDGSLDPRSYGFNVERRDPPNGTEIPLRVGALYVQILARTGRKIPELELDLGTLDLEPAEALVRKHNERIYPYHCSFGGATLVIDEGVFDPKLTTASPFLLEAVGGRFAYNQRVLDVFSGSGAFGIIAALRGASSVVTIDTARSAVECTVKNSELNCVADKIDARCGTMRECLMPNEKFDLIIANPPLLEGTPSYGVSAGIYDPGLQATVDFIQSLQTHLSPTGRSYLLTSSALKHHGYDVEQLCRNSGLVALPGATLEKSNGKEYY